MLTRVSPCAPESTHARAIATMSVTSGESLANTGTPALRRTAEMTSPAARASHAKTVPRSSTLGQLMLTSSIVMPGLLRSLAASLE